MLHTISGVCPGCRGRVAGQVQCQQLPVLTNRVCRWCGLDLVITVGEDEGGPLTLVVPSPARLTAASFLTCNQRGRKVKRRRKR